MFKKYSEENPDIDPAFLFMTDGYNFRNHEVCAVFGLSQIKRLDKNIEIRRKNYQYWMQGLLSGLGTNNYIIPENQIGNSSFSFPIIAKDKSLTDYLKRTFRKTDIEYRPIISGNILMHPAFKKYKLCSKKENPNVDILHTNGVYVGNSQFVNTEKIDRLISLMGV